MTQILTGQNSETEKTDEIFSTIAPRVGIGMHDYLNCELGISALYISNRPLQWGAASFYSTYVFQQTDWQSKFNMHGIKIGIQSSWGIFMWGLEWKNMNYKGSYYNYLSPKIGLSWLDVVNIEYLINALDMNENFPLQSRHQIAINFSLNRKIYNNIWKKYPPINILPDCKTSIVKTL